MALTTPQGRKALTSEEQYKARAELLEAERIRKLSGWQGNLIRLRIGEAKRRHDAEIERIEKSTTAITSAQAIVSDLKRLKFDFKPGQADGIIEADKLRAEQIADFRTGHPKILSEKLQIGTPYS